MPEAKFPQELRVDESYRNTGKWHHPDDQFYAFFHFDGEGINNTSGFKPKSIKNASKAIEDCGFCLLVTNYGETEWPDSLNSETGLFTYYGDNRKPGKLTETNVGGNRLLESVFRRLHEGERGKICPFLCFENYPGVEGQYMRFLGLAVPGAEGVSSLDDLVAVWHRTGRKRFQNYRSLFTILSDAAVPRTWLEAIFAGEQPAEAADCPKAFKKWVATGRYEPLTTPPPRVPRSKADQLPKPPRQQREEAVLHAVRSLTDREFEHFTKELLQLMDSRFFALDVTREVVDHGRDVVGKYRVGHEDHWIALDVCAEAKHWKDKNSVGVKEVMRLISRIKHRDFGVLVTTSHLNSGVQKELIEDSHPVIIVAGGDIARILIARELEGEALERWLDGIRKENSGDSA